MHHRIELWNCSRINLASFEAATEELDLKSLISSNFGVQGKTSYFRLQRHSFDIDK